MVLAGPPDGSAEERVVYERRWVGCWVEVQLLMGGFYSDAADATGTGVVELERETMLAIMEDTVWRHGASDVQGRSVAPGSVGPDPASWEGGCDESESESVEEEEDAFSAHVGFAPLDCLRRGGGSGSERLRAARENSAA